jgi:hypothetical protein
MSTMNNDNRQWFKQSERPVTQADLPVWCAAPVVGCLPFFTRSTGDVIHNDLWTHAAADIPAPPKKEETQEEKDHEEYRREMVRCNNDISGETYLPWRLACKYARQTERDRLGKEVDAILSAYTLRYTSMPYHAIRALFAEPTAKPTNTEAK